MMNSNKLFRLFQDRTRELESIREAAQSDGLRQACDHALAATARAVDGMQCLADALSKAVSRHQLWREEDQRERSSAIDAWMEEAKALAGKSSNPADPDSPYEWLDCQHTMMTLKARSLEVHIFLSAIKVNEFEQRCKRLEELVDKFEENVLKPDHVNFPKEASTRALEFGVGLIPVAGPAYDAANKVREMAKLRSKTARSADGLLSYLEAYSYAALQWSFAAEAHAKFLAA